MRTFISVLIALVIFFGLAWWNSSYLTKTSKQLADQAEKLRKAIIEESWDDADTTIIGIRRLWGQHKKIWLLLVDHDDIDDIDEIIYKIDEMVNLREKEQALSDIAELRFLVQDLADKEVLSLANIF